MQKLLVGFYFLVLGLLCNLSPECGPKGLLFRIHVVLVPRVDEDAGGPLGDGRGRQDLLDVLHANRRLPQSEQEDTFSFYPLTHCNTAP